MYKVFFNHIPLIFCQTGDEPSSQMAILNVELSACTPENIYRIIGESPHIQALVCCGFDQKKAFQNFKNQFHFIEAAGGIVYNGQNQLLAIKRLGKWDLPKGKREKDESIEECAVREVAEECGIKPPIITGRANDTFHVYEYKNSFALKQTYWFTMKSAGDCELTPQTEEDITEVKWLSAGEMDIFYENTYASIKDLLENPTV